MTKTQRLLIVLALVIIIPFGISIYKIVHVQAPQPIVVKPPFVFHSPNKIHLDYGQGFQVGNVGIDLFQGNSSFNADQSAKQYGFNVWYINSLNNPQTVSNKALSIGCIAEGHQSFKSKPSIFLPNVISLNLNPFQVLQTSFQVDGSCQYIGTADGKYWWDVPKFGE